MGNESNDKLIQNFLAYLKIERNLSDNTIESYKLDLEKYNNFLIKNNISLINITHEKIVDFLWQRKEKYSLSSKTIARFIVSIKTFHRFLILENYTSIDPTINLFTPKLYFNLPEYLTVEEVDKLINVPKTNTFLGLRNKTMLEMLYSTGMRISEMITLERNNIDIEENFIKCKGKGNKERLIPITKALKELIIDYIQKASINPKYLVQPFLFISNWNRKFTRTGVWKIIKICQQESGINKNITPHMLRHSFATHLLERNIDISVLQRLLGHSNISTTQIYTHIDKTRIKEVYKKYHPRG